MSKKDEEVRYSKDEIIDAINAKVNYDAKFELAEMCISNSHRIGGEYISVCAEDIVGAKSFLLGVAATHPTEDMKKVLEQTVFPILEYFKSIKGIY